MAAGAGASLAAAMAARSVFRRVRGARSYAPLAAYRMAFGALALAAGRPRHGRLLSLAPPRYPP